MKVLEHIENSGSEEWIVESGEVGLKVRDCKELKVWQGSFELTKEICMIAKRFPEDERYGLSGRAEITSHL